MTSLFEIQHNRKIPTAYLQNSQEERDWLREELETIKQKLSDKEQETEKVSSKLNENLQELEKLQTAMKKKNEELQQEQTNRQELEGELDQLKQEHRKLNEQVNYHLNQINQKDKDLEEERRHLADVQERLRETEQERDDLRDALERERNAAELAHNQANSTMQKRQQSIERRLDQLDGMEPRDESEMDQTERQASEKTTKALSYMRKNELIAELKAYGLSTEGRVEELRARARKAREGRGEK